MNGIQWGYEAGNTMFGSSFAASKQENNSIFSNNQNKADKNSIAGVQNQAQKKALRKLVNQMKEDLKTDDALKECETQKELASDDMKVRQEQIQELDDAKEKLLESYGMTDEDIEWQYKSLVKRSLTQPDKLSAEDKETLANLPDSQKSILLCEAMKEIQEAEIKSDKMTKASLSQTESEIAIERLKQHPMTDAKKEADAIMENAKQTVLSMLREQGTNRIDEEMKELQEKQEAKGEEEEKQAQHSQPEQTALVDTVQELQNASQQQEKVQSAVKELMAKELLVEDDLKGIDVDELL